MACTDKLFGFELFQKLYENDMNKKEDIIVLFTHWYLIKNGYRCIGIGDNKIFDASEKGSELLPTGWNTCPNYSLRYLKDKKLYVLICVKSDDRELFLNFLKNEDDTVTTMQLPIENTVSALNGPLETMMPSYSSVMCDIQELLVGVMNINSNTGVTIETQTDISYDTHNSQRPVNPATRIVYRGPSVQPPHDIPENDPTRVGARDLDPFSPGGGMIYDPIFNRRPRFCTSEIPRLPRGAVPPGARFDPLVPPDLGPGSRPFGPDNDHLRSTDAYFEHMFM